MEIKTSQILADFKTSGVLESMQGEDTIVKGISPAEKAGPGDLVFIDDEKYIPPVSKSGVTAIVTNEKIAAKLPADTAKSIFVTKNVGVAHALLKQKYADRDFRNPEWGKRHATAVIHETAKIHESVNIGPGAVIGKGVSIGENTVIMPNVVIEYDANIGTDCVIYPGVYIGYNCVIGNRVVIKPGSIIGSEGYGFSQDEKKASHRIPQTGNVVLEDDVLVGANNCIDRAAYLETRIGRGTKLDNLCHIAHNVQVGVDCLLTAGLVVAGSTKLGNRIIASGMTGILDHLEVADDVILVHRAGVVQSIKEPGGVYAALPATPIADYMKQLVHQKKLGDFKKDISDLKKEVEKLKKA